MNYESQTAEEAANHYLKEVKQANLMRYLTLAVFIFLVIRLGRRLNVLFVAVILIVFYMAFKFLRTMDIQQFSMLGSILSED